MDLKEQCCTLAQGKELKELGIEFVPYFSHFKTSSHSGICMSAMAKRHIGILTGVFPMDESDIILYPAFTVAEMGEILPEREFTIKNAMDKDEPRKWDWQNLADEISPDYFRREAHARADRLIQLVKTQDITNDDVVSRLK